MAPSFQNDQDLLDALKSQSTMRVSAALKHLCQSEKLIGAIRQKIRYLGGDESDVKDILNQALVTFFDQVETGHYDATRSGINTYIVSIASNLFYTQQRSDTRRKSWHTRAAAEGDTPTFIDPEDTLQLQHQKDVLNQILHLLTEKCRKVLQLYSLYYTHAEIAEMADYRSAESAKMAVYDCRKKLNIKLSENPEWLHELRTS